MIIYHNARRKVSAQTTVPPPERMLWNAKHMRTDELASLLRVTLFRTFVISDTHRRFVDTKSGMLPIETMCMHCLMM